MNKPIENFTVYEDIGVWLEQAWCHNNATCIVVAKLNGAILEPYEYPIVEWTDRYSVCIGCGKYINKPRAKR